MAGFDQAQFDRDRTALMRDLRHYNLHKDTRFTEALNGYLDQLQLEGQWVAQGHTPDPSWVGQRQVDALIGQFDRKHAFHVPADWWRRHRNDHGFREMRRDKAVEAAAHGYLWSKTEPGPAAKRAAADKGLILETSVPGKLFDGKNFGFEKWSDSPTMGKLWENFSTHYVDGLDGPVKALVLDGIVDNSVLTRLEWPHLRERIEAGDVPHLRVNVMNIVGDPADSRTWTLDTVAGFDVRSQESFDNLPRPAAADFWTKQGRWHARQRAEATSDSSSSGSSDEYSLHNFHEVFDKPYTIVVLSDPDAAPPQITGPITASPEQLSRVTTNQLSRTGSGEGLAGQGTPESAGARQGADLLASAMLDSKLEALRAQQARSGSDSNSPVPSVTDARGQGDEVSRSAEDFSRLSMAPAPSGSGYPSYVAVSNVPYTTRPQTGPYASYPVAPVSGTQSFNPGRQSAERTPSTASSEYEGPGLERVNRVPSDPPAAAPAREVGSSSERRSGQGNRRHQEPPAWLKWAAGGGPSGTKKKGRKG